MKDVFLMLWVCYINCVQNLYDIQKIGIHSEFEGVHLYAVHAIYLKPVLNAR